MEIFTFIVSVIALLIIFLIVMAVIKKNIKTLKVKFGFIKGFELSCSFENPNKENHQ